jgi:hypothetical protein
MTEYQGDRCVRCGNLHDPKSSCFRSRTATDIRIETHFSVLYLLWPSSQRAAEWMRENVQQSGQFWGDSEHGAAYVVEPRYVADILNGAREAGLEVR